MSTRPEDANPSNQPQPIDNDADADAPIPLAGETIEENPGGGDESERPIIIPAN